ncbi:hypothetical protein JDN40_04235 [Rhodomicrobium vannielii ATCC 17100]|uniref:hypothetical protein n=1 Tax=Rhodomicrobium vannielii TaxID=1069 RepID=UPI001917D554|nr:hypothetical protein [Rhodomicrobium vannielii]MBJ7533316.1 hypothetical protein [Rhodomicrobium vannielii ATCC 17100]
MNAHVIGELSQITRRKCTSRLNERLSELGITVHPTAASNLANPRGGAYFLQFQPANTSFQLLPGFTRYFQVAQRHNLISSHDAEILVRKLIDLGARARATYEGRLSQSLHSGLIGRILDCASDPEGLRHLEDTESWFPDILHEQLRFPCVTEDHLTIRDFTNLRLNLGAISRTVLNPLLALVCGVDLVRLGPWLGLTASQICAALDLYARVGADPESGDHSIWVETNNYAEKIIIPVFSSGLQGTFIGFFCNLDLHHKQHIRNVLDQAGRELGEELALERKCALRDLFNNNGYNAKTLADAALQIASPAEQVIVTSTDAHYAYVICREKNYLAGYETREGDAASSLIDEDTHLIIESPILDPPFKIYLKTIQTSPSLDPVIHSLRVQLALFDILSLQKTPTATTSSANSEVNPSLLTKEELDQAIAALEHQMKTEHGRRGAAKNLCFLEFVRKNYSAQVVRISNREIQRRMSEKIENGKVTGYQVTGKAFKKFELEIQKLLAGKLTFKELNARVIQVTWRNSAG